MGSLINEVAKGMVDDMNEEVNRELKAIEEVKMWEVAGLSLSRPISLNDIKLAVENGFEAGKKFAVGGKSAP